MIIKTRGIVLKSRKYSETSVIADIYTEAKGLRSYIIGSVRTKNARVSAGLLQIMTAVEIVVYHREDRDLTRIREIKPLHVYQSIPFDIRKSAVGMFMTEIARKTIQGPEAQPLLFSYLLDSFRYLDETAHPIANLHLHFMVHLTEHLGFFPDDAYSATQPYFDLREGQFLEIRPAHPYWLAPALGSKLSAFLQMSRDMCHQLPLTREERKTLLLRLLDYYRLHIENLPGIHSHEILEEVLY